jgi:hypothetical protein
MDVALKLYPSRKNLDLQLHVPTQESECPILQESIQTAVFENFPHPFYRAFPEHKAITLGCSHTFHAMALVYHWSRNQNVLCPICRAGPIGQRLVLGKLPEDWRYSLSSKVKREKKKDRDETERENYRMAAMLSQEIGAQASVIFTIHIEIQALTTGNILISWRLPTSLLSLQDCVVFEVPWVELSNIPFAPGTLMRFIPFAYSNALVTMLHPSTWFMSGNISEQLGNFQVEYDNETRKFKSIKLTLHEDEFSSLIIDSYFSASGI